MPAPLPLGVTLFMTDRTMGPVELAREAEARGFHALYLPEHTHIPTSRLTPAPMGEVELPEAYKRTLDPYVALAAAAAVTRRIRLGTGVSLVAQHDPVVLAKEVATLDRLCDGRFVLGVGFGWNREEMETHGVDFRRRRARAREHVLAMRALWGSERAAFTGEFVHIAESWSWPKPVQRPGPPVLLGGEASPGLFAHVTEWADGWMPIGGRGLGTTLPDLRRVWEQAGRDPAALRVVVFGARPGPGKLEHFASLGASEVVLRLPGGEADQVLPVLDEYAKLL